MNTVNKRTLVAVGALTLVTLSAVVMAVRHEPPAMTVSTNSADAASPEAELVVDASDAEAFADTSDADVPRDAHAELPSIHVAANTKSPMPQANDWYEAQNVKLARSDGRCFAVLLREWLRVTCNVSFASVSLLAGSAAGIKLTATEDEAQIILPLRRGDSRVFQVARTEVHPPEFSGYRGDIAREGFTELVPAAMVSEDWIDSDEPAVSTAAAAR